MTLVGVGTRVGTNVSAGRGVTVGVGWRGASVGGDGQAKVVATTLDTAFVVRMTDAGGNPIQGIHVDFALSSTPSGAIGQSLSTSMANTDVNGEASTVLTLGTKAGNYIVTASSDTVAGSVAVFTARAVAGAAVAVTAVAGDGQTRITSSRNK